MIINAINKYIVYNNSIIEQLYNNRCSMTRELGVLNYLRGKIKSKQC